MAMLKTQTFLLTLLFFLVFHMASGQDRPFIFTWEIEEPHGELRINVWEVKYTVDYWVDFGDGSERERRTGDVYHQYAEPGIYTVKIWGSFPGMNFQASPYAKHMHSLISWGDIVWGTMLGAFTGCYNLTYAVADPLHDVPNLDSVNTLFRMFEGASKIDGDFSAWDVSNVITMSRLFKGATSFTGDLSAWDVSWVKYMDSMFEEAYLFDGDVSAWDVSRVVTMEKMFYKAEAFQGDVSRWDVRNVRDFSGMFAGALQFSSDVSEWSVDSGKTFTAMFAVCPKFNADVSGWDVRKAEELSAMFYQATSFDQNLGAWQFPKATSLARFLSDTHLSIANYDATLKGWSNHPLDQLPKGVEIGVQGLQFSTEGSNHRSSLMNRLSWRFDGDSLDW
ncbi:MAG TPA: hypothetical protein DCE41_01370 [Cytophagales bacterium]|nr:hypothetical protein [Cytophagales bacterium]HAA22181.1 hypothetical protein [Cytophagales bacterium]HAP65060.1 hypothetical protein [Cytophagales bacterium]